MANAKDRAITVGNAATVTAALANAAALYYAEDPDSQFDPADYFMTTIDVVTLKMIELQAQYEIIDEFPGTVVVPGPVGATPPVAQLAAETPAQAPVVVPQQNGPQPVGNGPAPVPGGGESAVMDALWNEFFADCDAGRFQQNWYDNRANKKTQWTPDFKHKTQGDKDKGNKVLYLGDKKNPAWVTDRLRQMGLVS